MTRADDDWSHRLLKAFHMLQAEGAATPSPARPAAAAASPTPAAAATSRLPTIPTTSLPSLTCPVCCDTYVDPVVVGSSGITYCRDCIEQWLGAGHSTCPMTNQQASTADLNPNFALREVLQHVQEVGVQVQATAPPLELLPAMLLQHHMTSQRW